MRESISHGRWCAGYIRQHHEEIDLIYNDSWHLFGVYLVARAAQKYGIPYITPVQDVYPESLASKLPDIEWLKWIVMRLLSPLDCYVLSHATCVQTNSEKMADYLSESRQIERGHFVVVRNWQDEKPFAEYAQMQRNNYSDRPFTFMYLGNVGSLAGIELLFEAFAEADLKDARLVIAGSGPAKESLQRKAAAYSQQIEFWDVPTGMVPETQAKADVMLLPIKKGYARYSVPSKLIAYMFSAKPIIASVDQDSDTADCIKKSGAGWTVKPEDCKSLSEVMKRAAFESSEKLKAKGMKGLNYAIEVFSKERNSNLLCKVIKQRLIMC